jgi:hypothetical protein
MISAKLFVLAGASLQFNSGEILLPWQVNFCGIDPLSAKAGLLNLNLMALEVSIAGA